MRKLVCLLALTALTTAATGASADGAVVGQCKRGNPIDFACSKTFTATRHRQTWIWSFKRTPPAIATRYAIEDRQFLSGYHPNRCVEFARYREVRIRESLCGDEIGLRFHTAAGAPTRFVFDWQLLR